MYAVASVLQGRVKPKVRRVALALLAGMVLFGLSAGTAYAGYYGKTWLNWVVTGGNYYQKTGYTHLKQVGAQPKTYDWGCANMWNGVGYTFGNWYCGSPSTADYTPNLTGEGVWAQPIVWNDNPTGQALWGWEYYYA